MRRKTYWNRPGSKDSNLCREVVDVPVSTRVGKGHFDELGKVGGGFEARHIEVFEFDLARTLSTMNWW